MNVSLLKISRNLRLGVKVLKENHLKQKIAKGEPVIGTWNTLASPLVTEVMAHAGFDFQIIDLEHGPFALDKIHHHVSACESVSNCTPIVRVPKNEDWMVLQALDQGAYGIVLPHIADRDDVEKLAAAIKYHPVGGRGFTPFSKAGGFNNLTTAEHVERSNRETVSVGIIESKEGLANLEMILENDAIDIIYFGAYDLSQVLGHPGDVKHPEVAAVIKQGVEIVAKHGKCAGAYVPQSQDDVKRLLDMGIRFITYDVDSSILHTQVRTISDWFHGGMQS